MQCLIRSIWRTEWEPSLTNKLKVPEVHSQVILIQNCQFINKFNLSYSQWIQYSVLIHVYCLSMQTLEYFFLLLIRYKFTQSYKQNCLFINKFKLSHWQWIKYNLFDYWLTHVYCPSMKNQIFDYWLGIISTCLLFWRIVFLSFIPVEYQSRGWIALYSHVEKMDFIKYTCSLWANIFYISCWTKQ